MNSTVNMRRIMAQVDGRGVEWVVPVTDETAALRRQIDTLKGMLIASGVSRGIIESALSEVE
jgi:hypothetical protein